MKNVIVVGCSDGIGLALVKSLLDTDHRVIGISKSPSGISHQNYEHLIADVTAPNYTDLLKSGLLKLDRIDLCVYCAGIGEVITIEDLPLEEKTFEVNLVGAVKTATTVLEVMFKQGHGHLIGLSSIADAVLCKYAPSYYASKSGLSSFLESMALFAKDKGVNVSNIRFGLVDTKMAKGDFKPFMLTVETAVEQLLKVIERPRMRFTKPLRMEVLARIMNIPGILSIILNR